MILKTAITTNYPIITPINPSSTHNIQPIWKR